MKKIEIKILNPESILMYEKMLVTSARLTQTGHKIKTLKDFEDLYNTKYSKKLLKNLIELPHPTIQKFSLINIVIIGCSRRFLAQITRHQNEVKFMSASLQYSDYSNDNDFCIPYKVIENNLSDEYILNCKKSMIKYNDFVKKCGNDDAGYLAPSGLRNVLLISATPYQLKHMISQRTCNRNTFETQYIMLKIWEELYNLNPVLFANAGPFCTKGICKENKMSCKKPIIFSNPSDILKERFPILYEN